MQAMLDAAAPGLKTGAKIESISIRADLKEGDIGTELGEVARAHPGVMIGSYPFFDDKLWTEHERRHSFARQSAACRRRSGGGGMLARVKKTLAA